MILAFDEGAWHPDSTFLLLPPVLAIVALIFLFGYAGGRKWPGTYLVSALPFIAAYAFVAHFDYGNSGSYSSSTGSGARHLDLITSLSHAWPYALFFAPIPLLLMFSHWGWLRAKVPPLFWTAFVLGAVLQLLLTLSWVLVWFER